MLHHYHIYAKANCPFCVNAINLMHEVGYEFTLTLLDHSPEYYHKLKQKYDHHTVPMVVEYDLSGEERFIGGFTDLQEHFAEYINATEEPEDTATIPV